MEIIARSVWADRPPKKTSDKMPIPAPRVNVHHTVTGTGGGTRSGEIAVLRQILDHHMDVRGFDDIGYSFIITQAGRVYEGQGWGRVGAHSATDSAPSENLYSYGLSLMADTMKVTPSSVAVNAYVELIRFGIATGRIIPDPVVRGHRNVPGAQTACPGTRLYALLDDIRTAIKEEDDVMTDAQMQELKGFIASKHVQVHSALGIVRDELKSAIEGSVGTASVDAATIEAIATKVADKLAARLQS